MTIPLLLDLGDTPMESDPVVSSTVAEAELPGSGYPPIRRMEDESDVSSEKKKHGIIDNDLNETPLPFWRLQSELSDTTCDEHSHPYEFASQHFRSDNYLADFEIPEMEFDEFGIELAGDKESSPDLNAYCAERMTSNGLIDEDFERELGFASRELSVQDVIDSDFADISRLGLLQVAGDDKLGRKVIVFSACRLPAVDLIDHQRLLLYITKTLEQYVIHDYCLIYFHCGLTNRNKPRFGWLVQAYRTLDRDFRKNLKALYIVHPTMGIKFLWSLFKPFISSKMAQKVAYIEELKQLEDVVFLNQIPIPHRVLEYDKLVGAKLRSIHEATAPAHNTGNLNIAPRRTDIASVISGAFDDQYEDVPCEPQQQFNVSLQFIKMNNGGRTIPVVVEDAVDFIRERGMDVEWIFRRSTSVIKQRSVQEVYNRGLPVDLREYNDPHLAAALLKSFLRELTEPLLTFELYDDILSISNLQARHKVSAIKELVATKLPDDNYELLNYLMRFLTEVTEHSTQNKMNATNLAVVFGPCLVWSRQQTSLNAITVINAFVQLLITHYEAIFIK